VVAALNLAKPVKVGLPAALSVATGLQFRRENYQIVAGERASYIQGGHLNRSGDPAPPGSQVFGGFQPANAVDSSRSNIGGYLDLETDLTKAFLVNLAGRFEHYSDFGSKVTGKLALRYAPSKRVTLRGALSTGFRAPSPSQRFYGATITNFVLDPSTGRQKPVEGGIFPVANPAAVALGARPLKAETSVNLSAGLAVSPTERVTFTGDVFYVKIKGRIILTAVLGGSAVEAILQSKGFGNVETAQYFTNALDTRTTGVDLTGTWRIPVPEGQRLEVSGVFNWTRNRILNVKEPLELAGTGAVLFDPYASGGKIALEKERPDWRTTLSAEHGHGPFHALLRYSLYGPYTTSQLSGVGPEGGCADCVQRIGSAGLLDAEVGHLLPGNLNISVGVKNLLDKYPDRLNADNSFGIFLYPQPSPFGYNGRFVYTKVEMTIGH
jgi:iron complex outermembrane receptor protein